MLSSDTLKSVLSRRVLNSRALWPAKIRHMVIHHFIYKNIMKNYVTGATEIKTFSFLSIAFSVSACLRSQSGRWESSR